MLKYALLAGAMTMAVPALAQTMPNGGQTTPPVTTPPAPATPPTATPPATAPVAPPPSAQPATPAPADAITPDTAPSAPMPPAPSGSTTPAAPVAPATPAAPTAAAAPAAPSAGAQVADIVGKEFSSYDKNGDGKLSQAEFGAWAFALRKAADPNLKNDAANKTWTTTAFGQADADKSKSISKDEMTNFLAQGSSKAS